MVHVEFMQPEPNGLEFGDLRGDGRAGEVADDRTTATGDGGVRPGPCVVCRGSVDCQTMRQIVDPGELQADGRAVLDAERFADRYAHNAVFAGCSTRSEMSLETSEHILTDTFAQ